MRACVRFSFHDRLVNDVINKADQVLDQFRRLNKQIIFATNNSTKSRATLLSKIHALGLWFDFASQSLSSLELTRTLSVDVGFQGTEKEVMVPSYVCGAYLLARGFTGKVYVFGSSGIEEELKRLGIRYVGFGPDPLPRHLSDFSQIELDPEIEAVIVGFDYDISYPKLIRTATYARRVPNDLFIATNSGKWCRS
jgi:ribonucleotide monophosphatase NagD (HAD superfamily)